MSHKEKLSHKENSDISVLMRIEFKFEHDVK